MPTENNNIVIMIDNVLHGHGGDDDDGDGDLGGGLGRQGGCSKTAAFVCAKP